MVSVKAMELESLTIDGVRAAVAAGRDDGYGAGGAALCADRCRRMVKSIVFWR